MNLTGFSICSPNYQVAYSDSLYISDISLPSFSDCLNAIPGVLVAGSERREDKNKEI